MSNKFFPLKMLLLLFLILFLFIGKVNADNQQQTYILDIDNLLTSEEKTELNLLAKQYSDDIQTDIITIIMDKGYMSMALYGFTGELYNDGGIQHSYDNLVVLALDISSREFYISNFHEEKNDLNTDKIIEKMKPSLVDGDYGKAIEQFTIQTNKEIDQFLKLKEEIAKKELQKQNKINVNFRQKDKNQHILDLADYFDKSELESLEKLARKYSNEGETDFVVLLISEEMSDGELIEYYQNMYDLNGFGYDKMYGDAVIMAINLEIRRVEISGFYKSMDKLDDHRIELVLDDLEGYLRNDQFYFAIETFFESATKYMNYKVGINPDNILLNSILQLIIALLISFTIVGVIAAQSGGRSTINERTYRDEENTKVLDGYDKYIRTSVTRRRKENDSSGSGGSSGSTRSTSGGHRHSSGGRSF